MKTISRSITISLLLLTAIAIASAQAAEAKSAPCPGENGLTASEVDSLLEAQNKVRADAGLKPFTWNCRLADFAQEWATRGIAEHRPDNNYGENLFVSSDRTISPVVGVERWLAEQAFWNADTSTCQEGKMCLHYTQIVWGNTTKVGCGVNRSATGKWPVFMVCNYDRRAISDSNRTEDAKNFAVFQNETRKNGISPEN